MLGMHDKLNKGLALIRSCETLEQLSVARKYIELLDRSISRSNSMWSFIGSTESIRVHLSLSAALLERQAQLNGYHKDEGVEDHWL